jgi:tripartite-type tricarboxylate transporter receptor subunit TctC
MALRDCLLRIIFVGTVLYAAAPVRAQDSVEQFFRGKTVNIVVGSAVGGGFDGYARMRRAISANTFPAIPRS